jgi:ankyrin repeat protein
MLCFNYAFKERKMPLFKTIIIAMVLALSSAVSYANQQEESEALFLAAHIGHLPSVAAAVDNGANVNYMNSDRETAMHAAASRGHLHVIQYLRAKRGNMNARTVQNWIPLHHAVRFGHEHVANYLLQSGAPLYFRTTTGQNVFDIAEGTGNIRMLNLLSRYRR